MKKIIGAGLVVLALLSLVAVVAVWVLSPGDEASKTAGALDQGADEPEDRDVLLTIKGTIEYTVRDPDGNIREHGVIHNTLEPKALDVAFSRLIEGTGGVVAGYDAIGAMAVTVGTDDPADGVQGTSMTDDLDGDSSVTTTHENPADGTVNAPSDESGSGTVAVTFTARADGVSILQIILTKASENDTAVGNVNIADADILAHQDLPDVTLNTDDTVQYTWTIDLN